MSRLLEALHSGRILLMDGAMGTELQRAGMPEAACYEEWNLTHPEKVLAIHKAYVDAGAEVLLTNTFQAHTGNLERHNLGRHQESIWRRGTELARSATGQACFVIADLGPLAQRCDVAVLQWVSEADGILLETLSDDRVMYGFVMFNQIHDKPPLPIFGSFTFLWHPSAKFRTHEGLSPAICAAKAEEHGLTALGVNCGREIGLTDIVEIVQQYRAATDLPLFARPNAGTPTKVDGGWHYPVTPEQMAAAVSAMIEAGATMIGGCCGTTPAHIAAMKKVVDEWNAKRGFV